MVHNYGGVKFNRRQHYLNAGRHTPSPRFQTTKVMSTCNKNTGKLELDPENYTAYVLLQLFDAFYQPWLKECNADKFVVDFTSRLDHLNLSLENAFPSYPRFKGRIVPMAKRYCFNILRKLKVSVEDVRKTVDNSKHKLSGKCLRVRIITKNMANNMEEAFYHSNYPIQLHSTFSMFLDIPIEMNDGQTKVYIQFLLTEYHPAVEQLEQPNPDEMYESMLDKEMLLVVKEHEISGFTGYSTKCTVHDDQIDEQVEFRLNLTWDLNAKSITEQVKWLEIVASHFSPALLALGTYFWRFYCSLYTAMLLHADSEIQAIKCLNEVAFLIGPQQKMGFFKPLLKLLDKRMLDHDTPPAQCHSEQCFVQFRLVHGVFLILELLPVDDQLKLLAKVRSSPFIHLLRFNCLVLPKVQLLQLHRLLLRRLAVVVKKTKFRARNEIDPYFDTLVEAIIDSVKRADVIEGMTEEEVNSMQDEAVNLFAKFYNKAMDIDADECEQEESHNSEEPHGDHLEVEGDETDDEEYSSAEEASITQTDNFEDVTSRKSSTLTNWTIPKEIDNSSSKVKSALPQERTLLDIEYDLAYENFVCNPDKQAIDCALMHSVLPSTVMHKLYEEKMLEGDNYQHTVILLRKIAQKIELFREDKDD